MCHDLTNGFQCDTGFAVADTSARVRDRSFSAISTCHPSMIVLASLVDPMADVWIASVFTLVLAKMDLKKPSQTLSRNSLEASMIAAQMDCAMISPWDSSASVSDGDSAYADRICLPVVCAIRNLYRCL